jgi:hypothetical protein
MIVKIDASAISKASCFLRFARKVLGGYSEKGDLNNDMVYGTCVHIFCEEQVLQPEFFMAVNMAQKKFKSTKMKVKDTKKHLDVLHLHKTCLAYGELYGEHREKDTFQPLVDTRTNKPMVEIKFALPIYKRGAHEILLCGTMDEIGKFNDGCVAIKDIKTTSLRDKEDYFKGYELSPQLMVYLYAFKWFARQFPDSIYAELLQRSGLIGCFIEGVFLNSKETEFKRSKVMFFDDTTEAEFEILLMDLCKRLVDYMESDLPGEPFREGMLNGSCEVKYGKCEFFNVCAAPTPEARRMMLESFFDRKPYDPLNLRV